MEQPDFLVIGAGVAGLRAAIELSQAGNVLVTAKDSRRESSLEYAQGGIAVALSDDDEVRLHERESIAAGAGLSNPEAVHTLVEEGPASIERRLSFTREAAHSRNRILHAHGDSTGREIARTLYRKPCSLPGVTIRSLRASVDRLVEDGEAAGAPVCERCRIIRTGEGLAAASRMLSAPCESPAADSLAMFESRNIHTVALLIAQCALAHEESRGAHFRFDFPSPRAEFQKHSIIARGNAVSLQ